MFAPNSPFWRLSTHCHSWDCLELLSPYWVGSRGLGGEVLAAGVSRAMSLAPTLASQGSVGSTSVSPLQWEEGSQVQSSGCWLCHGRVWEPWQEAGSPARVGGEWAQASGAQGGLGRWREGPCGL